jgi:histidyl-tRNA synthetase
VLAGGRYDGLIGSLGGPETPGVGWAAGVERLAMLIEEPRAVAPDVVVVPIGDLAETQAIGLVAGLRRHGARADMAFRGNLKRRLTKASSQGARYAMLFGEDELAGGKATIKDLESGQQVSVGVSEIEWIAYMVRTIPEQNLDIAFFNQATAMAEMDEYVDAPDGSVRRKDGKAE